MTDPVSNGLGSDCLAIVWDGARLHGLNAAGPAPAAWSTDYFKRKHQGSIPVRGWDSVTVPGCVAGWAALHKKLGYLAFEHLLAPAIEYAERGFTVSPMLQYRWAAQADALHPLPGFAEHFLPQGRPPKVGEHFILRGAADTLKRIAVSGGRDFYEGETAHKLVAHAQAHEATLALPDLRNYMPQWVTPISQHYRGYTLHQLPAEGQGLTTLMTLGILQHFDLAAKPSDHANSQHLMLEAAKLACVAAQEQEARLGQQTDVMAPNILDPAYLAECARRINHAQAQAGLSRQSAQSATTYLSVADRHGMMVSLVQSNHMGFGSGIVVPGTGVSLQNRGCCLNSPATHPREGVGGQQPPHRLYPAFLSHQSAPVMSFGVVGENRQCQGYLQALVRMLDYQQQPQAACDAFRWRCNEGLSVYIEPNMPIATQEALRQRGHLLQHLEHADVDCGAGQFIWRLGDPAVDGYVAASDSRHDGLAAGF